MESVYNNLVDINLISKITVIDDNSSEEDRRAMEKSFPDIEYVYRNDNKGQAHSMKVGIELLTSKYVLWWEDDFIFKQRGEHIIRALGIINRHPEITSVIMRPCNGIKHTDMYGDYFINQYDHEARFRYDRKDWFNRNLGQPCWPGWSTNSSLQLTAPLQQLEYPICKGHEHAFSLRYYNAGNRVAHFDELVAQHFGGTSAYDLNESGR